MSEVGGTEVIPLSKDEKKGYIDASLLDTQQLDAALDQYPKPKMHTQHSRLSGGSH